MDNQNKLGQYKLGQHKLGVVVALIAAFGFALSNTLVGLAYEGGADTLAASGTRFILPALLLLAILIVRGGPVLMPGRDGIAALLLGGVTALYTLALLKAIDLVPVPIAILVLYLFPIFTSFISAAFGWAPLHRSTILAAFIAFAGLALTLGVRFHSYDIWGIVFAVLGALGLATVSSVSARVIRGGDPRQTTLYVAVGATAFLAIVIVVTGGDAQLPSSARGWWGLGLSSFFYAVAMITFFHAISLIGAPKTTLLSNLEPLVVIAVSYLLLGQSLEPVQLVGAAIVVGALYLSVRAKPATAH